MVICFFAIDGDQHQFADHVVEAQPVDAADEGRQLERGLTCLMAEAAKKLNYLLQPWTGVKLSQPPN